jgi:hypothetical protein
MVWQAFPTQGSVGSTKIKTFSAQFKHALCFEKSAGYRDTLLLPFWQIIPVANFKNEFWVFLKIFGEVL